jgi:hypothetical protein
MTDRKNIKVTIPAEMVEDFYKAKEKAEASAMLKLSETQYATRLIQWAITQAVKQ